MVLKATILSTLSGYTGPGTTWADDVYFDMNHAPGAGSIARPVDLQSSTLPLYYGCSPNAKRKAWKWAEIIKAIVRVGGVRDKW